jgi:hypothetical protein
MALSKTERNGTELGSATSRQLTSVITKQQQRSAQRCTRNQWSAQPQIPNPHLRAGQLTAQEKKTACPSFLLPIEENSARGPDLRKIGEGQGAGINNRTFLCLALSSLETDAFSFMAAPAESSDLISLRIP